MTFEDYEDSSDSQDKRPNQFFVRMENLPWSASPRDIKALFHGLDVLPGGISILGKNAFVSFERWEDMSSAMLKDGHVFYGKKLFLSIVDLKKVQKINDRHIQRSLHFLSLMCEPQKAVTETSSESLETPRKIRPTTLINTGNHSESNAAFIPKEIDSPTKGLDARPVMKSVIYRPRRIKPTPVREADDYVCF